MQDSKAITLLIVEEHPVTRWGLSHFLGSRPNIRVVGEVDSIAAMFDEVKREEPDVILMDFAMGDGDGLAAVRFLLAEKTHRILAFSAHDSWDCIEKFFSAGGMGFVPKRCAPEELIQAIESVYNYRKWISPSVRQVPPSGDRCSRKNGASLSPREREVVTLVARGLTSRQIASQLSVSIKTVETHRYRIFKELRIQNRAQLVHYAINNGFLTNMAAGRTARIAE